VKLNQRRLARPSLGGMLATRQGSLTLALICAALAAGVLVFALGRYKTSLKTPVAQATVLVATSEIPAGTPGNIVAEEKLYRSTPVQSTQVTAGALSDAGALAALKAQTNILPGQQLTTSDFAAVSDVADTLTPTQRALSLSIQEAPGDADALKPGDHVDVYSLFTPQSGNGQAIGVLLESDVLVLKTGTTSAAKADGVPLSGSSMVIAVEASKAAQIVYAAEKGQIYVSLRPPNATTTPPWETTLSTILAEDPPVLNKLGPVPASLTTPNSTGS
jgi:Flp pilus assembly protein CpaB